MRVLSDVSPAGAALVAEQIFLTPRRHPRPTSEAEVLETARKRLSLPSTHGQLAAWEWGPADGPTVLLVHGWEGRGAQLGAMVAPLAAAGYRVVTFDAPGHGDSPGRHSSLIHFADAIASAAETLGPIHAIVAHSMGGPATLWAMRSRRLASRLVLIAPPLDLRDFSRELARTLAIPKDVRTRLHRRLAKRFGVPIEVLRADDVARAVRGPMLIIHDEDDQEVPVACGEAIARAWPGAAFVRTRGLGHRRILRQPDTVAAVARFISSPDDAPRPQPS
jgi:pimeloyl-ACP methyl ester carboxylesterase